MCIAVIQRIASSLRCVLMRMGSVPGTSIVKRGLADVSTRVALVVVGRSRRWSTI